MSQAASWRRHPDSRGAARRGRKQRAIPRGVALLALWITTAAGCAPASALPPSSQEIDLTEQGTPREGQQQQPAATGEAPPVPIYLIEVPAAGPEIPSRGPRDAPVVIQVFSDFQCPFCQAAALTLDELQARHPSKVRLAWRNLPLPRHTRARAAAAAALEAFSQRGNAGFWAMHDRLFAGAAVEGGLEFDALVRYAEALVLDVPRFRVALTDDTHRQRLDQDLEVALAAGVQVTPTTVVGDLGVLGDQPLEVFEHVLGLALERAGSPRP